MPIIPMLGRLRQGNQEVEGRLDYKTLSLNNEMTQVKLLATLSNLSSHGIARIRGQCHQGLRA